MVTPRHSNFSVISCPWCVQTWWASMNVWGMCKKRMGTALREKAKEKFVNERGERVRMRGKGWITDKTIKLLTRYYGKDIRSSSGVCAAMQDAAWEVFYHSQSSVPVLPQWPAVLVQVQLGTANSEPSPPHSPTIHPDIVPPLKMVFERLFHPTLMESCVLGATQNLNESFNSTIWQHCPKTGSSALQPRWRLLSI